MACSKCKKDAVARGFCRRHYVQAWRAGDVPPRPPREDSFWAQVDFLRGPVGHLGTRCWLWTGCTNSEGYGRLAVGGDRNELAHRFAYGQLIYGPTPAGVDHRCHIRSCVNAYHLRPADQKENMENRSGLNTNNTSGVRGVYWNKARRKWQAYVHHNRQTIYVGLFADRDDAEVAVIARRNELFTHNDLDRIPT